jgi:hypothetical protein
MKEFDEKVKEILETHKDIETNDWRWICFAMFTKYEAETNWIEFCKKAKS